MTRSATALRLGAVLFGLLASSSAAHATKIRLVNLESMVHGASRIFSGICTGVEDTTLPDSELPVTRYTFRVTDRIKGDLGDTVVVSQIGVREPRVEGDRVRVFRIPGMPVYRVGQEVALFLVPESRLGLSSPVGLSQGAFQVEEKQGKKMIWNGLQNAGLWKGLSREASARRWKLSDEEEALLASDEGPMDYDRFVGIVRKILQSSPGASE